MAETWKQIAFTDDLHTQGTDTALGAVGTKDPPVDADKAIYRDSTDSDALVTSTFTQVKAFLKTYFDTLYNKYVHPNHSGDVTSTADGAQVIVNMAGKYIYRADGTDVPIVDGGTGQSTAQAAIDALSAVSGATNEHVLTKDTATGNAVFKAAAGGGDVATDDIWDAAGDFVYGTGANTAVKLPLGLAALPIINLKPVVNVAVNKLDIFSKSGGATPDATDYITVSIPDVAGVTTRKRAGAVASGTGQIVLADAANYWSKGDLAAEIKTIYLYAIWSTSDSGIVWALGGYSGFTRVPASTTATDDDFFLLEASSTYTKVITDYCVAVAKIRYEYDTGDTPDHTIQSTVLNAPQVCWNPKGDYSKTLYLASTTSSESNIAEHSVINTVLKQSGKYEFIGVLTADIEVMQGYADIYVKLGSSTYGSAVLLTSAQVGLASGYTTYGQTSVATPTIKYANAGDTVHLGGKVTASTGGSATRRIIGAGHSSLSFKRID